MGRMKFENKMLQGDSLKLLSALPDKSVDMCVTSPPYYGLRDYGGIAGQIGAEKTPYVYIERLASVFMEVHRVLKNTGSLWLNIGDSYAGSGMNSGNSRSPCGKQATNIGSIGVRKSIEAYTDEILPKKSLMGIPWRLAFALQKRSWILRQDIIWAKPSPMPESIKDRFCKSHEYLFFFVKQPNYYFNFDAALEPAAGYDCRKDTKYKGGEKDMAGGAHERWPHRGYTTKDNETGLAPQHHGENIPTYPMRIKRDVWFVSSEPSSAKHYAMFPQKLIIPCVLCGCPENGIVLDPFMGSGTTAVVAKKLMRKYIGCELNPEYIKIAEQRIAEIDPLFEEENDRLS